MKKSSETLIPFYLTNNVLAKNPGRE